MKHLFYSLSIIGVLVVSGQSCSRQNVNVKTPEVVSVNVETVVEGLGIPWGIDFLPNGDMLIGEKVGRYPFLKKGKKRR